MASEAGHWYAQDGEPMYTIVGANGKVRNTTLRDARKLGLVPSVTTIMNVADKPALTRWKVDQALMAALTLPQVPGESLDAFKKRADEDAKQQAIDAADEGTRIHGAVEAFFLGHPYESAYRGHVIAAAAAIQTIFPDRDWSPEKSFCSSLGYGGKVDLHCADAVVDFKTKDFGPEDSVKAYDEQIMQLDAYRHGLGIPNAQMANVYISRSHPGEVRIIVHEEGNHFERFKHLLAYWQLSKGYSPFAEAA